MQLPNFVGMWSYAGSLNRSFSLTLIKFLNIIVGLPPISIVMLRQFGKTIRWSLKLLSWNLSIITHFFLPIICSSFVVRFFLYRNLCSCRFIERAQALIHGDLHTGSVMVTRESTQVIDPEFAFYGPMGFDIGAFLGNLILAFFAQDGHADQANDRKVGPLFPCLLWSLSSSLHTIVVIWSHFSCYSP